MASNPSSRGEHLLKADRGFSTGSTWISRLFAPGFHKLLDHIHRGLATGSLEAKLPDGRTRLLGGHVPGVEAQVELKSWRPLVRLMTSGSVGWYRGWAEGEWTSADPPKLFELFVINRRTLGNVGRAKGVSRWRNLLAHSKRANTRANARRNIEAHYDLGNDFYAPWLDETMTYSSAIFAEPFSALESEGEALEEAQRSKVRALLDRLDLKPGDTLLEVGCGWGGLMEIAAKDYGAQVTGITLSSEQKAYTEERLAKAGLTEKTSVELVDYRDVRGTFDAIASVEMVEAVGQEFWPAYLQSIAARLKSGGKAAIQLISLDSETFDAYAASADFIQTYIFPGGMLIDEQRFADIGRRAGLAWEDRKGFNLHYAETLRRWRDRYDRAIAEDRLPQGFDERFHNLWRYYLMYCEGGFRAGGIDVAQVTLRKT